MGGRGEERRGEEKRGSLAVAVAVAGLTGAGVESNPNNPTSPLAFFLIAICHHSTSPPNKATRGEEGEVDLHLREREEEEEEEEAAAVVMMESQPLQDPTATAPAPGSAEPAGAPPAVVSASSFLPLLSFLACSAAPLLRLGSDSAHCLATEPGSCRSCRPPARSSRAPARASSLCSSVDTCCSSSSPRHSTTSPSSPPSTCLPACLPTTLKRNTFFPGRVVVVVAPQDIPLTCVCALQDNPLCMDRLHRWLHRASPPRGELNSLDLNHF